MGKFLTLLGVLFALLTQPSVAAESFSFTDTLYSRWVDPLGTQLEIVNNPEDQFLTMTNDMTGYSENCTPKEKKRATAVYQCKGRVVKATYSNGVMHFNGVPYKRMKEEF